MTLLAFEGFETVDTTTLPRVVNIAGSPTVGAFGRRSGNGCRITVTNVADPEISKLVTGSASFIVGVAFRISNLSVTNPPWLIALYDGIASGLQVELRVNSSGFLYVTRNGTTLFTATDSAILVNVYYYVEFKVTINNTTGSIAVKLNGATVGNLTQSSIDTQNTANASANTIIIGWPGVSLTGGSNLDIDDLYICNSSGSVNNDFLGDSRVDGLVPTGAGNSTQWTPSAGSNWQNVDDIPADDDSTYNSEGTVTEQDLYIMSNLVGASAIRGIKSSLVARKDDAGAVSIRPVFRRNAVEATGAEVALGDTYVNIEEVFETDPTDASALTVTKINDMEFGVRRTV